MSNIKIKHTNAVMEIMYFPDEDMSKVEKLINLLEEVYCEGVGDGFISAVELDEKIKKA